MFIKNNKNQITAVILVVVLSVALLASTLIFANSNIYIKNLGSATLQDSKLLNTITVSGTGKVSVRPDMATLSISISEVSDTSAKALAAVNSKVDQIYTVLRKYNIPSEDVTTSQLSIYPEYSYKNEEPKITGQRATSAITVKIKKIDDKATKATQIIDEVSVINNIQLGSISFDVENRTQALTTAREIAFNDAKTKAEELTKYSGTKIVKPVSITDSSVSAPIPVYMNSLVAKDSASGSSTQVSTGSMEIDLTLNVIFGIE